MSASPRVGWVAAGVDLVGRVGRMRVWLGLWGGGAGLGRVGRARLLRLPASWAGAAGVAPTGLPREWGVELGWVQEEGPIGVGGVLGPCGVADGAGPWGRRREVGRRVRGGGVGWLGKSLGPRGEMALPSL